MSTGTYSGMTIEDLYRSVRLRIRGSSVLDDSVERNELLEAACWVEAENDFALRAIVCEWFQALETGEAEHRYPDPEGLEVSQEKADQLIKTLDQGFEKESLARAEAEAYPDFHRLKPHARVALAQEVFGMLLYEEDFEREAQARLAMGEAIPPKEPVSEPQQGVMFGYPF